MKPRVKEYVLLNPGPVVTSSRVKRALLAESLCHRDDDFSQIFLRLQKNFLKIFQGGEGDSILFVTGSGTSAMEMGLASIVPQGRKVLVISNGSFGERWAEIAEIHHIPVIPLRYAWGKPIVVSEVEEILREDPGIFAVAMTHHETSVGILNPLTPIGKIVKKYEKLFLVDCISSVGGEDVNVLRDEISIAVTTSNKCVQGIAGIAVLYVRDSVWEKISSVSPRSYYLNLKLYRDYAKTKGQTPFTPAVNVMMALDEAVAELLEEGLSQRQRRYGGLNQELRVGLEALGLRVLNNHGSQSKTLLCVEVPPDLGFQELYLALKKEGFLVYNAKEDLQDKVFQVSTMGNLSPNVGKRFLRTLERLLTSSST